MRSHDLRIETLGPILSVRQMIKKWPDSELEISANRLLYVQTNDGAVFIPLVQFIDVDERRVVPGIPEVLTALARGSQDRWEWVRYLTGGSPGLDGRSPLDALRASDVDTVVADARRVAAAWSH
ncbi:hypothetical protein ASF30_01800 [Leifsonia sp. Leaf264]|nr:hypothetical protein ASF30_01800 [Leifsonia sp. Leaf264]